MLTRQKEFLQWIFGGLSTSALIVGGVWVSDHRYDLMAEAGLASTATWASLSEDHSPKAEALKQASLPGGEKKASSGLQIDLTSPGLQADGTLVLNAAVLAVAELPGVSYEWLLPPDVTVVSGSISGTLGSLTAGSTSALVLNVRASSTSNAQVNLRVFQNIGNEKIGQIAHYNTLDQPTMNEKLETKRLELTGALARTPASESRRME